VYVPVCHLLAVERGEYPNFPPEKEKKIYL
jgi:hypothetical protein